MEARRQPAPTAGSTGVGRSGHRMIGTRPSPERTVQLVLHSTRQSRKSVHAGGLAASDPGSTVLPLRPALGHAALAIRSWNRGVLASGLAGVEHPAAIPLNDAPHRAVVAVHVAAPKAGLRHCTGERALAEGHRQNGARHDRPERSPQSPVALHRFFLPCFRSIVHAGVVEEVSKLAAALIPRSARRKSLPSRGQSATARASLERDCQVWLEVASAMAITRRHAPVRCVVAPMESPERIRLGRRVRGLRGTEGAFESSFVRLPRPGWNAGGTRRCRPLSIARWAADELVVNS